jgi:hypothetical protein
MTLMSRLNCLMRLLLRLNWTQKLLKLRQRLLKLQRQLLNLRQQQQRLWLLRLMYQLKLGLVNLCLCF